MAKPNAIAAGVGRFRESLSALRRQPLAFTGIVVFSLLVSGVLSGLPLIGALLASCWMPFGAVLTGYAARDTLDGKIPTYRTLVETFRNEALRWPLFGVGLLASLWYEVEVLVFELLGRDALAKWVVNEKGIDFASVADNLPTTALIVVAVLYVPLLMLTAFSPLLIADKRQPLGKSLFYSFFGILRNFGSVFVFVLCLFVLTAGAGLLIQAALSLAGVPHAAPYVAPLAIAVLTTVSQAGVWVMYRDFYEGVRRG